MHLDIIFLHTSGHADREAMKLLNKIIRPQKTFIIHTDASEKGNSIFSNVIPIADNQYYEI